MEGRKKGLAEGKKERKEGRLGIRTGRKAGGIGGRKQWKEGRIGRRKVKRGGRKGEWNWGKEMKKKQDAQFGCGYGGARRGRE